MTLFTQLFITLLGTALITGFVGAHTVRNPIVQRYAILSITGHGIGAVILVLLKVWGVL